MPVANAAEVRAVVVALTVQTSSPGTAPSATRGVPKVRLTG
jgi:hypothetical protein